MISFQICCVGATEKNTHIFFFIFQQPLTVSTGGDVARRGGGQVVRHPDHLQLAGSVRQQLQPSLGEEGRSESTLQQTADSITQCLLLLTGHPVNSLTD